MFNVAEIAEDVYRISVYVPEIKLQFNHFLVRDEEPLLFHAGLRAMFPLVREAVAQLIDPSTIRHVGFSHFESDECGALNQWLEIAPRAEPVCGLVGALVSVNDFAIRPARTLTREDSFNTGKHRFRFLPTPHVPHGWDAGVMFEETKQILFCSDYFTNGRARVLVDRKHHRAVPRRSHRSRSWAVCKLRAVHTPHRTGAGGTGGKAAANACGNARLQFFG